MKALVLFTILSLGLVAAAPNFSYAQDDTVAAPTATAPAPAEKPTGDQLVEKLPVKWQGIIKIVLAIFAACFPLATAITMLTKTPKDDEWVGRIRGWFEKWFSVAKRNPGGGFRLSKPGEETN